MMQNGFNYFGAQMPFFIQPMPVPEPPRVINPKPMVPDLSITSDIILSPRKKVQQIQSTRSDQTQNQSNQLHQIHDLLKQNQERFMTIYPVINRYNQQLLDDRQTSSPVVKNKVNFVNEPKVIRHSPPSIDQVVNSANHQQKSDHTRTHHQLHDHHQEISSSKRSPFKQVHVNNTTPTNHVRPSNEEMYEMLKQQDEQLQRISDQIQELLRIHKIQEKRSEDLTQQQKPVEKRSVMTMTSLMVSDDNKKQHNNKKIRHPFQPRFDKLFGKQSTTSKELRNIKMPTICEQSPSNGSIVDVDVNQLNLSESLIQTPTYDNHEKHNNHDNHDSHEKHNNHDNHDNHVHDSDQSIELCRNDDNHYYDQILDNINFMLNKPNSTINDDDDDDDDDDDSVEKCERSSCSPTPPKCYSSPKKDQRCCFQSYKRQDYQVHLHSEQTLYIKRLAAKYLAHDEHQKQHQHQPQQQRTKPKYKQKNSAPALHNKNDEFVDLNVYGLARNASIATKNYLEKYNLTLKKSHKPPHVVQNHQYHHNHHHHEHSPYDMLRPSHQHIHNNHHHHKNIDQRQQSVKNRILDIEALKRQPKLT